ncbi:MAG: radical SAM protein [Nanoarchaeota archaeon]|nr:radical SAM protein [Nanoarchaeota archaeon]
MKVLFANPPWSRSQKHIASSIKFSFPPLGLLQLGSYAQAQGLEVKVVDNIGFGSNIKEFIRKVEGFGPDLVCLTTSTTTFENALKTVQAIKASSSGIKTVLGGPHVSVLPDEALIKGVDFVVRGEGEKTFEELVKSLKAGKGFGKVKGLSFKQGKKVIHNRSRVLIKNIDELPFADRELVPIKKYVSPPGLALNDLATNMIASRGCPFRCSFCSNTVFGKTFRPNSAERMVKEVGYLKNLGFKEVFFNDDVFTLNKKRVFDFCNGLEKDGLDVLWSCSTRADCLDREMIRKMKKSGCHTIGFGVESSDQKFIDQMNKDIKLKTIEKAIRLCKEEGLNVKAYYLIGYSNDVESNAFRDLKHAIKHGVDYVKFALMTPYPGTQVYTDWKKNGLLVKSDWKDFDGGSLLRSDVDQEKVKKIYDMVYAGFYLRPGFVFKQIFKTRSFLELKNSFYTLKSLLKNSF